MSGGLRPRFWLEAALAGVCASLYVATVVVPDWIEVVFGVDPDRGSGALEVLVSVVALTVSVSFALLAHVERRRLRPQAHRS
jgi:hypothetical protein